MIHLVTRIKVAPGKTGSHAVEWAKRLLAYENKARFNAPGWLLRPRTGDGHAIMFVHEYATMAEYDEHHRKQRADPGWREIGKELLESDWYHGITRNIYDVVEGPGAR
jgi:hypothetical protein